jgi:hypothetical protein
MVETQAGLTLLGNITLMIAAYRIARSNGWNVQDAWKDANPFNKSPGAQDGTFEDANGSLASFEYQTYPATGSENASLALKLLLATSAAAYGVKYGSLYFDLPFTSNGIVGGGIIAAAPLAVAAYYASGGGEGVEGSAGNSLSFSDVKKFGAAGTLAYVITELAFWALAFPAAGAALYKSTGHWPDVINEVGDRTAVMGFVLAGANIARLAVPVRLGAAMALAPWVDENIINRGEEEK